MSDRLVWAVAILAVLGIFVVAAALALMAWTVDWRLGLLAVGLAIAVIGRSGYSVLAESPSEDE